MENTCALRKMASFLQSVTLWVSSYLILPTNKMKKSNSNQMLFEKPMPPCFFPPGEDEQLILKLINRPILILRGENGYVCHHKNSNTLDANRSVYDIFTLQFNDGAYQIKGEFHSSCIFNYFCSVFPVIDPKAAFWKAINSFFFSWKLI